MLRHIERHGPSVHIIRAELRRLRERRPVAICRHRSIDSDVCSVSRDLDEKMTLNYAVRVPILGPRHGLKYSSYMLIQVNALVAGAWQAGLASGV